MTYKLKSKKKSFWHVVWYCKSNYLSIPLGSNGINPDSLQATSPSCLLIRPMARSNSHANDSFPMHKSDWYKESLFAKVAIHSLIWKMVLMSSTWSIWVVCAGSPNKIIWNIIVHLHEINISFQNIYTASMKGSLHTSSALQNTMISIDTCDSWLSTITTNGLFFVAFGMTTSFRYWRKIALFE